MSNNCLLTKLNTVVNNDNLPILNSVTFFTDASRITDAPLSSRQIDLQFANLTINTIEAVGGNFLDSEGTVIGPEITLNDVRGRKTYYFSNTTQKIIVPKGNLMAFRTTKADGLLFLNFQDLIYALALNNFNIGGEKNILSLSDLGNLKSQNLTSITIADCTLSGDLADMADNKIANSLTIGGFNTINNISGDFASWAPYRTAGSFTFITNSIGGLNLKCNGVLLTDIGITGTYILTFDGEGGVTCAE